MRQTSTIGLRTVMLAVMLLSGLGCWAQAEQQDTIIVDEFAITPDSVLLERDLLPDDIRGDKVRAEQDKGMADALIAEVAHKPKVFVPDPIRAMWLGLILPGGGQIYNRKYWKLPIIYGGFLGCAYALTWNNQMLRDYSQAYLDIMDNDPNTKSYEKMLPLGYDITGREDQFKDIFKSKKNYYRKYRDMSIFAFAAVYIIAVIDAYVDAELSTFDISRDLSLKLSPAVISTQQPSKPLTLNRECSPALGMAFRFNF